MKISIARFSLPFGHLAMYISLHRKKNYKVNKKLLLLRHLPADN
jgi:hypothetical protein